jgi:hypothetical protein
MKAPDFTQLIDAGLNLQAIFNIDDLPDELAADIRKRYDPERRYRQLILIGHGGTRLWDAVKAADITSDNPIDDFSIRTTEEWLAGTRHAIVYPGEGSIGLQTLGKLAGWHHPSPFMVGINASWGSWYAYRVVALADSDFTPSKVLSSQSPCQTCQTRICIASCPANALASDTFDLKKCIAYRKLAASRCRASCVARVSCPAGAEHRYCDEQIRHTYSISMRMIEQYY